MLDWKITGGQLLDGTGSAALPADVGVKGDRITCTGDLSRVDAVNVFSAAGHYVCPGFIDAHSHSDTYLLLQPESVSKIFQGITTEIIGNCGVSAAPLTDLSQLPADWADKQYPSSWQTVAEYLELLEKCCPAPNVCMLIGHGKIRAWVMGYEARPARPEEIRAMTRLLEECLDQGGIGLSTGLIYPPGLYADIDELEKLAGTAARHQGIYASHMRSEGRNLIEAVNETISIGRKTGIRVEISHLKTAGRENWPLVDKALDLIRNARKKGMNIAADRYPYTAAATELDVVFPGWMAEGGRESELKRLRSKPERERLKQELLEMKDNDYWNSIVVGSTGNVNFRGKKLTDIAEMLDMHPVDAALFLIDADELKTGAFFFGMNEENMWKILAEPWVMPGTDASLRAPYGLLSHDFPHPRAYGSFPRFLKSSLQGRTVPVHEAVRKMTSLPATHFNLKQRGVLSEGFMADIVVFDPEKINDTSTFKEPHKLAEGIELVMVNGIETLSRGKLTGKRAGRVLRGK